MLERMAAMAVLVMLAGCAGLESAGRNASRAPEPARVTNAPPPAATPAPAPTTSAPAAAAAASPPPSAAASDSTTPPAPTPSASPAPQAGERPAPTASRSGEDVVVPGVRERQVPPPGGDPRSNAERMQDIRAWDQCVMRVQAAFDRDPMRPQLETPEEYCAQSLGMAERTAVPQSRLEQRR